MLLCAGMMSVAFAQPNEDNADRREAFLLYQKALQAFSRDDFHDCIELCREALNYTNSDKNIYHLQALAQAQHGDNADALNSFHNALNLDGMYQCLLHSILVGSIA